jgi:hypothetical protein
MIRARDRLALPAGVSLDADGLRDDVRGVVIPLNATGRALVDRPTPEAMAAIAVTAFAAPPKDALVDAIVFAAALNERHLLNVDVRGGGIAIAARWLGSVLILGRHRSLPAWPTRRRALDTSSAASSALGAAVGAIPAAAAGAMPLLVVPPVIGAPLALSAALAIAVALGVAAHEAGHASLLAGVPAFLGRRCVRVAVVHRPLSTRRTAFVALAGPACGIALALLATVLAWTSAAAELVAAQLALAPQAVALTVMTPDGRRACGVR